MILSGGRDLVLPGSALQAAAGPSARCRPPRPGGPSGPGLSESLTPSQHWALLAAVAEYLPDPRIRLCRAGEWTPGPVCPGERPDEGEFCLDPWFLLEVVLDGELVRVVSECTYGYASAAGAVYTQRFTLLCEGTSSRLLCYGIPVEADAILQERKGLAR